MWFMPQHVVHASPASQVARDPEELPGLVDSGSDDENDELAFDFCSPTTPIDLGHGDPHLIPPAGVVARLPLDVHRKGWNDTVLLHLGREFWWR
jgi:hypothetical protein